MYVLNVRFCWLWCTYIFVRHDVSIRTRLSWRMRRAKIFARGHLLCKLGSALVAPWCSVRIKSVMDVPPCALLYQLPVLASRLYGETRGTRRNQAAIESGLRSVERIPRASRRKRGNATTGRYGEWDEGGYKRRIHEDKRKERCTAPGLPVSFLILLLSHPRAELRARKSWAGRQFPSAVSFRTNPRGSLPLALSILTVSASIDEGYIQV